MIEQEFEGRPLLDSGLERKDSLRQMVTDEVQHVASETYLITRLSLTLLRYLRYVLLFFNFISEFVYIAMC